jgi:8-oxo-dGTP pyrophosphatase MutT (NUDIX family)
MSDFKLYRLTPFLVASVGAAKLYLLKQKRHACVVVLDGDKVLLLRRSITDSWKPCKWALPGGGVEKDENFIDAAIRELKEETHLDIDDPKKLQLIKVSPNGKIAFYLARNIHKGDVNLDQASHGFEHEDFHWATKKELEFMRLVPDLDELLSSILST